MLCVNVWCWVCDVLKGVVFGGELTRALSVLGSLIAGLYTAERVCINCSDVAFVYMAGYI